MSLIHAALQTAHRLGPVLPLIPENKNPLLSCPRFRRDPHHDGRSCPLPGHGWQDATRDRLQINRWWSRRPKANIGLATGSPSGVVVVDVDADKGGEETLAQLEEVHGRLTAARTAATPDGGRHFYFSVPPGLILRTTKCGDGIDLLGDGRYVVVPPSMVVGLVRADYVLEDGGWKLRPPPDWLLELWQRQPADGARRDGDRVLGGGPSVWTGAACEPTRSFPTDLDEETRELLVRGDTAGRYPSNSEVAIALAHRFRRAGRTFDDYEAAMTDPNNAASQWFRDHRDGRAAGNGKDRKSRRGHEKAVQELRRNWMKASRQGTLDATEVYERCERLLRRAHGLVSGRARPRTLYLLHWLCGEAQRHRTVRVLAPVRDASLGTGLSTATVSRTLKALSREGFIRRCDSETEAHVYELVDARHVEQTADLPWCEMSVATGNVGFDVFRRVDAGPGGWLVYSCLEEETCGVAELAAVTRLHRATVSDRLRLLAEKGLAVEVEPGQWKRGTVDPAEAASEKAIAARERDEMRFAGERAQYHRRSRQVVNGRVVYFVVDVTS